MSELIGKAIKQIEVWYQPYSYFLHFDRFSHDFPQTNDECLIAIFLIWYETIACIPHDQFFLSIKVHEKCVYKLFLRLPEKKFNSFIWRIRKKTYDKGRRHYESSFVFNVRRLLLSSYGPEKIPLVKYTSKYILKNVSIKYVQDLINIPYLKIYLPKGTNLPLDIINIVLDYVLH